MVGAFILSSSKTFVEEMSQKKGTGRSEHFPRHEGSRVEAISVQMQDRPQINLVGTCLPGDQVVIARKNNNRIHSKVHPNMPSNSIHARPHL